MSDVIDPAVQQLVQIFSTLEGVSFPELDAPALREAIAKVKDRQLELASAEAQVMAMRAALEEEHEGLLRKAHRLQAYLQVFSDSDDALRTRLEAVALPRVKRAAKAVEVIDGVTPAPIEGAPVPKKRGRPRKVVPASDGLFAEAAPS
jgi:methionine synthase II (cobalamin-independent)